MKQWSGLITGRTKGVTPSEMARTVMELERDDMAQRSNAAYARGDEEAGKAAGRTIDLFDRALMHSHLR